MLCNEFDPAPTAIINPGHHEAIPDFPEICVGIFSKAIVDELLEKHGGEVIGYSKYCTGWEPIHRVRAYGAEVTLFMPHVGAPAAAGFMEDIWAWGGKHFVFCGAAGALRRDITHGHLIIPTAAIRDEGILSQGGAGLADICFSAAVEAGKRMAANARPV